MSIKPHHKLVNSYYKLISHDKIRFIIVGGIGFIVNFVALTIFYHLLSILILFSQIISAELALLATFIDNNFWAFSHHHHHSLWHKFVRFHFSALAGLAINSSVVIGLVHFWHVYYGLALIIGSMAGLIWNYNLYKHFVFKTQVTKERSAGPQDTIT